MDQRVRRKREATRRGLGETPGHASTGRAAQAGRVCDPDQRVLGRVERAPGLHEGADTADTADTAASIFRLDACCDVAWCCPSACRQPSKQCFTCKPQQWQSKSARIGYALNERTGAECIRQTQCSKQASAQERGRSRALAAGSRPRCSCATTSCKHARFRPCSLGHSRPCQRAATPTSQLYGSRIPRGAKQWPQDSPQGPHAPIPNSHGRTHWC